MAVHNEVHFSKSLSEVSRIKKEICKQLTERTDFLV